MTMPTAFYELFLGPELNHSAGYFATPDMSLETAQRAKNEALVSRCRLRPSMRLLDAGCGWGAAVRIAAVEHGIQTVGIMIDPDQYEYAVGRQKRESPDAPMEYRIQPWNRFTDPVDGIICVNSFETFEDKLGFIEHARGLIGTGGRLVILAVTADRPIYRVISTESIVRCAESVGFDVEISESLAADYIRTAELWLAGLERHRSAALDLVTADQYATSVDFYRVCAALLRKGRNDMFEFTLTAR